MGQLTPVVSGVDPTWHVDIRVEAAGRVSPRSISASAALSDATRWRHARVTQAVSDAIAEADSLCALHAGIAAALSLAPETIAAAWLYRRNTLQGPRELRALSMSQMASPADHQSEAVRIQLLRDCEAAVQTDAIHACQLPVLTTPGLYLPRCILVLPLKVQSSDVPDGALAFALGEAQVQDGPGEIFFAGLTQRTARACRVHEQREHTVRIQGFLNNAMEAAYAGTWHIDLRTGQTLTSPTTNLLFGEPVTNQDVFGLVNRLIHPDDRDYIRRTYYEAIRQGVPYYHEYRIIRRDGVQRWLCSRGIPVYGTDGKPAFVSGIIADITQRVEDRLKLEQLAKSLQEAVGARDVFLARASHELKTPLTALQLLIESQQRKLGKQGIKAVKLETLLSVAKRELTQAQRLRRLIDDMMDVSRIHAKRLAIEPVRCDVSRLIEETAQDYVGRFLATEAQLHVAVEPNVIGTWDPGRLEQVVTNLLNNALRYAPGKDAHLSLRADAQSAILQVHDEGPGVPEHLRGSLFESFRSGDSLGSMGGLGLGLHICKEIAHLHKGSLTYTPGPNVGSRFVLTLPLSAQTPES